MGRILIRPASADVKDSKVFMKLPRLRNLIRIGNLYCLGSRVNIGDHYCTFVILLSFSENFSSLDLFIKKSKSIIFLYLKAKNDSCPSNLNIECYTTHPSSGRNGFSEGFPEGGARGKSRGKPIPARTWMCSITFYV